MFVAAASARAADPAEADTELYHTDAESDGWAAADEEGPACAKNESDDDSSEDSDWEIIGVDIEEVEAF